MAFFMEFLRQKIIDNMQSHEEIDKFWHDRINHNKEVAKKWLVPLGHVNTVLCALVPYGCVKSCATALVYMSDASVSAG